MNPHTYTSPLRDLEGVGLGLRKNPHPTGLILMLVWHQLNPIGPVGLAAVARETVGHGDGASETVPGEALQGFEL